MEPNHHGLIFLSIVDIYNRRLSRIKIGMSNTFVESYLANVIDIHGTIVGCTFSLNSLQPNILLKAILYHGLHGEEKFFRCTS